MTISVFQFLSALAQEYRTAGLIAPANTLQFVLDWLNSGKTAEAIAAIEHFKVVLIRDMKSLPSTADGYSRDLLLLNTLQKMLEAERDTNG
jgi:hypothetical protein